MTEYVDAGVGVAAFRSGRSLCVRLDGRLGLSMARAVDARIRDDGEAVRLRLECSTLHAMEPVGARALAHSLLAWSQARSDRSVHILNLDPSLQRQVAWHPLRIFLEPDELIFVDPDRDPVDTFAPSRH